MVFFRALLRTLIKAADTDGNNEMDWQELENFSNFELIFTDWQEIVDATWMATEQMQTCGRVEYSPGGGQQDQGAPCLSQTNQPVSDILRYLSTFKGCCLPETPQPSSHCSCAEQGFPELLVPRLCLLTLQSGLEICGSKSSEPTNGADPRFCKPLRWLRGRGSICRGLSTGPQKSNCSAACEEQ